MKTKLLILLTSVASICSGYSALYTVTTGTAATSTGIASSGGALSDPGAPALVGTFTGFQSPSNPGIVGIGIFSSLLDSEVTAATSLSSIVSNFSFFGATGAFNVAGPANSRGVFSRPTNAPVTGTAFSGKNIYVLVGNGSTFGNSTELLVLKNSTLFADAQDSIPTASTVTINTGNTQMLFGRALADVRTTGTDSSPGQGWGTATVIPEPSAALLGAIGALGLLRRRRI